MGAMKRRCPVVAFAACLVALLAAQHAKGGEDAESLKAGPEDMRWWREARFGLFVHWGPVSLKGTEIGWSRGGERRGTGGKGPIPVEVYDNLYKEFNPVKFNAREWVEIAKGAGMKYLVFTTKHHDGFCMFDSKLTEYKITNSPFKRDVVAELAKACHDGGLGLGFYYSPPDWHHPDYRTEDHARYIEYLHGQFRELCSDYGRVDIIWFDGLGGKPQDWDSENLMRMIRTLQPHAILNNRAGLPGDFDTPEQQVGRFQTDRAWESCITIGQQWAWKPNDQIKSLKECIDILVRCAGGDGNLLLNVGPMPSGEIEPRQVARLEEIGAWLRQYGESIYGTRGGPFKPGPWGASTHKGNAIYLHVLAWDGPDLVLPPIKQRIVVSRVLTGGTVEADQTDEGITLSVPPEHQQEIDTIVEIQLDGPASAVPPRSTSTSLTVNKWTRASNVYQGSERYAAEKAVDDDVGTRWATDGGTHEAWLEIDLGKPMTFDRVAIDEAVESRVQAFELQHKEDDAWRTFLSGNIIGPKWTQRFDPVTARHVRLNIVSATEGPTLWEFHLYPPKK